MIRTGTVMSAAVTLPILELGRESFEAFGKRAGAIEQMKAVLASIGPVAGRNAKQLLEQSEALERASIFSRTSIVSGLTVPLLAFNHIRGRVFDQAQKSAIDYASRMKMLGQDIDLPEASRRIGLALQYPANAMRSLRGLGIIMSAEQQKLIKGLLASGQRGAGVVAQMMILNEITKKYGGSTAAALRSPIGQLEQLKNKWEGVKEQIGAITTGPALKLLNTVGSLLDRFQKLPPSVQAGIVKVALLTAAMGPLLLVGGFALRTFLKLGSAVAWVGRGIIAFAAATRARAALAGIGDSAAFMALRMRMAEAATAQFGLNTSAAIVPLARASMWAALRAQLWATATAAGALAAEFWPIIVIAGSVAAAAYIINKNWPKITNTEGYKQAAKALHDLMDAWNGMWAAVKHLFDNDLFRKLGIDVNKLSIVVDAASVVLKGIAAVAKGIAYEFNLAAAAIRATKAAIDLMTGHGPVSGITNAWRGGPAGKPPPAGSRPQAQPSVWDPRYWGDFSGEKFRRDQAARTSAGTPKNIADLISRGEGKYTSVNLGRAGGYRAADLKGLTSMTVAQVMEAQRRHDFTAAGRYQFIPATLKAAVQALHLTGKERFDARTQDRLLGYLLNVKRPQIGAYVSGRSADLRAAVIAASKEWASIADPRTGRSHYAGVGNNRASISAEEFARMLNTERQAFMQAHGAPRAAPSYGRQPGSRPQGAPPGYRQPDRPQIPRPQNNPTIMVSYQTPTHAPVRVTVAPPAAPATASRPEKHSLDITIRRDGSVSRLKSKAGKSMHIETGIDNTAAREAEGIYGA